jgi:hypothetical protein
MHPATEKRKKLEEDLKETIAQYGGAMRDFGKKHDIDSTQYIKRKKSFVNQAIHNLVEAAVDEGIEGYKDSFKIDSYDEKKRKREAADLIETMENLR